MKKIKSCLFVSMIFAALVCFAGCSNENTFDVIKPSEIAVSNIQYEVIPSGRYWEVYVGWDYNSADPASYLVICRDEKGEELSSSYSSARKNGSMDAYSTYLDNNVSYTIYTAGTYTFTVYTVGRGYSTSASASVTVTCER
ncbi:MAG: hypothetical protein NC041_08810 [Bacteroides sp.]|nr:hypothetical protein [Prevotella sp.]MCM1408691.1 hypothetical protein [Treponema brennaborense]MCM1470552.1 hypothetical protein [Bacteroides sp.]